MTDIFLNLIVVAVKHANMDDIIVAAWQDSWRSK